MLTGPKLALFGRPIKTSLSPRIHGLFAGQFGLDIDFQRIETGPTDFPGLLEDFRRQGGVGCNITLPLKQLAWQLAFERSEEAKQAQAANTLHNTPAGWSAHNTDGAGLLADLAGNHGIDIAGQRVLVLGAGGAAAGILASLLAAGPRELVLVNRDEARAGNLAARFGTAGNVSAAGWQDLSTLGGFNLVINATSLGHHGEAPPLKSSSFAPSAVCYDLNYFTASLPLRNLCDALGQVYFDGIGMLVEQAARSFYIWTGRQPDSRGVIESLSE